MLFGTGAGIAFFMLMGQRSADLSHKLFAARVTVLADLLFTTPAVIMQPLTGFWLVLMLGYDPLEPWLVATYVLYALAGACWLPVVWIQLRLKRMLLAAKIGHTPLPADYRRLFRLWWVLGVPAFVALLWVFHLMIAKPRW